jgi:phosphoribosylformylglycinamidine synthase
MKVKIIITPKREVVDPQGNAVKNALKYMGYNIVSSVSIGRCVEIDLMPNNDVNKDEIFRIINDYVHRSLSNPLIEDYSIEII